MEIWILTGQIDYQGSEFLGAFSSEEKAEDHKRYIEKASLYIFDDFSIDLVKVDNPSGQFVGD